MKNKIMVAYYDKTFEGLSIETFFDIITLYGRDYVDGVEINAYDIECVKECARLCKKNDMKFNVHFPLVKVSEAYTIKYLNALNEISKELRQSINIVFHSDGVEDSYEAKISKTKKNMENILGYIKKYKLNVVASLENLNYLRGVKRINVSRIDEVLGSFDDLAFTYDIGHDLFDNKAVSILSDLQIERLSNVHVHSVIGREDHHKICAESKDLNEIKKAISSLNDIGYFGTIVLEYALGYMEGKRVEERAINYIKSVKFFYEDVLKA